MTDEKQSIRDEARRQRAWVNLDEEDPQDAAPLFFDAIKPQAGQVIAAYWPKDKEFDPSPILEQLLSQDITCALPVMQGGSLELRFAQYSEGIKLVKGPHGIMQPPEEGANWLAPDIFIVPLLAFDRRGFRVGQGGGYYDATLNAARAAKDILAVGVGYARQAVLFNLPVEEHDEKLDWVITPCGTHYFGE